MVAGTDWALKIMMIARVNDPGARISMVTTDASGANSETVYESLSGARVIMDLRAVERGEEVRPTSLRYGSPH
jgi:hypothetical protein